MLLRFRFLVLLLGVAAGMVSQPGLRAQERQPVIRQTAVTVTPKMTSSKTTKQDRKTLYLFSGLGADYRAFKNVELPGYNLVYIQWIPPQKKEPMAAYAQRLRAQITTQHPILIGLSFGGMMAMEVAKIVQPEKVILISSAKTAQELDAAHSFFLKSGLYKLLPGSFITRPNFMVYRLFGAHTAADKALLAAILEDTDPRFFRWAMGKMAHWDNTTVPPDLIHIHGNADKVIPFRNVQADYVIDGGGHLMVFNRAAEISRIILSFLHSNTP